MTRRVKTALGIVNPDEFLDLGEALLDLSPDQVRKRVHVEDQQVGQRLVHDVEGGKRFVSESWAELKKVDWPGQHQLVQGTAVVIIACLITGVYLFLADELFRRFVQHVLLGG